MTAASNGQAPRNPLIRRDPHWGTCAACHQQGMVSLSSASDAAGAITRHGDLNRYAWLCALGCTDDRREGDE